MPNNAALAIHYEKECAWKENWYQNEETKGVLASATAFTTVFQTY